MNSIFEAPFGDLKNLSYTTISEHVEYLTGPAFNSEQFNEDGLGPRLARGINITKGCMRWPPETTKYWKNVDFELERYLLEESDVLVGMDGSLVGRNFAIVNKDDLPCMLVQRVARLRAKETISPSFLYQLFASDFWLIYVDVVKTNSGIPHISNGDIKNFPVPKLELAKQQKIAKILTTVDNLIEKTQVLIDKYTAIKQGVMADLFTRGIDLSGTPDTNPHYGQLRPPVDQAPELYKATELGWVPKEWELVTLESIADVDRGKFTHRPRDDERCYGGAYPFIQTGSVTRAGGGFISEYKQTLSEYGRSVSREFPAGTIAVTIAANIADTGILNQPMCFPDSIVGVCVDNNQADTKFIEITIRMRKRKLDSLAPLSAQKNINLEDLRPMPIALPNKTEQSVIAERYNSVDKMMADNQLQFDKLQVIKKGLMQDLLTGKVKV